MKAHLLSYLLEASICFEVLYVFYWLTLQNTTFFVLNRVYLLVMATAAWVIPLLAFEYESIAFTQGQGFAQIPHTISVIENPVRVSGSSFVWSDVVWWMYLIGVTIFTARFGWRLAKIYLLLRQSDIHWTLSHQRIDTDGKLPTFSFLDYLFWDNTSPLNEAEKEQIFQHELVHIRERHSWDILYAELLKVIFWVNPAVYMFKNELHLLHEYRADALTAQLYGKNTYTETLLDTLFHKLQLTFSHSFNQHSMQLRTTMLHQSLSSRSRLWRLLGILPLLAGLLGVFAFQESKPIYTQPVSAIQSSENSKRRLPPPRLEFKLLQKHPHVEVINERMAIHVADFPYAVEVNAVAYGTKETYKVSQVYAYLIDGPRPIRQLHTEGNLINLKSMVSEIKANTRLVIEVRDVTAVSSAKSVAIDGPPMLSYDIIE